MNYLALFRFCDLNPQKIKVKTIFDHVSYQILYAEYNWIIKLAQIRSQKDFTGKKLDKNLQKKKLSNNFFLATVQTKNVFGWFFLGEKCPYFVIKWFCSQSNDIKQWKWV